MKIIGLTGGIGMGKSTAAAILRRMGLPVYNADAAVHALLKKHGKAVPPVAKLFPETLKRGAIDRRLLGQAVFGQPEKLKRLENILHPLVQQAERAFLRRAKQAKARAVVLEIPLLFETGAEQRCAITLCVSAPRALQKARVLARPTMTPATFRAILARQLPDKEKRRRADYVVPTGKGLAVTQACLQQIVTQELFSSHVPVREGGRQRLVIRKKQGT